MEDRGRPFTPVAATSVARHVELQRLAVAGRQPEIARDISRRVCWMWLSTSRFAAVEATATATLALGPDADALYQRGWAPSSTGRPWPALEDYQQALTMYQQAGHPGNVAATLTNIGHVYAGLGDRQQALDHYHQALPMMREVGDRAGEATTRFNIAMVHRAGGDLDRAIRELELVVDLDRQVDHPDLEADTAVLEQLRQERAEGQ